MDTAMSYYFELSSTEQESLKKWLKEHNKKCKLKRKGKKRFLTYCFTPNGIGLGIEVKCSCGKSVDVTDIDSW